MSTLFQLNVPARLEISTSLPNIHDHHKRRTPRHLHNSQRSSSLKSLLRPISDHLRREHSGLLTDDTLSEIDSVDLSDLDSADLQPMGISNRVHRKKVYSSIQRVVVNNKQFTSGSGHHKRKLSSLIRHKSKKDLKMECGNALCDGVQWLHQRTATDDSTTNQTPSTLKVADVPCPSLQRVAAVLRAVDQWLNHSTLPVVEVEADCIARIDDRYDHQQLTDDFLHLQNVHGDDTEALCRAFQDEMTCGGGAHCELLQRHCRRDYGGRYMERDDVAESKQSAILKERESVKQQKLDQIHCFFLHSGQYRLHKMRTTEHRVTLPDPEYDEGWFQGIDSMLSDDDEKLYCHLTNRMGTFRWQSAQYVHSQCIFQWEMWWYFLSKSHGLCCCPLGFDCIFHPQNPSVLGCGEPLNSFILDFTFEPLTFDGENHW